MTRNNFDADDEETSTTNPDGSTTKYALNADGEVVSETDADGNTTRYMRDGLGDVVATMGPWGNVTSDVFNLDQQVVSQTDADNRTITYARDNNGNVLTETDYNADGSVQDTKAFTYDPVLSATFSHLLLIDSPCMALVCPHKNTTGKHLDVEAR